MPIIAKNQSGNFAPTPSGMQIACCALVEDIGLQPNMNGDPVHKIIICWELAEKMTDGRPFMVSKEYMLSLNEKATLRKDLESWRGMGFKKEELDGFDVEVLKGKGCLLNIASVLSKSGKPYAKVMSVSPLMKGMIPPEVKTDKCPEWIAKKREDAMDMPVAQAQNAPAGAAAQAGEAEAEVPF